MRKGNIFLLAAGYLAGLAVAMKYNKKSSAEFDTELAASSDKYKTFGRNFIDIHRNLFDSVESTVFSEENKRRIEEYKERFFTELEGFQQDADAKIQEWKMKGMYKKEEIEADLRDIYNRRAEIMEQAKNRGIELMDDAKDSGIDMMEEGKRMANKVYEKAKRKLDDTYDDLRKKLK